jgi:hypothetical protein
MPLKIPPSTQTQTSLISQRDIGAGANLKASRFTIPPNQMVLLRNFYLIEDGTLMGRRGTKLWNAATLGVGAILGSTRAYFAGNNHFLAAFSGTIYKGDDLTKTFASSLTGWSTTSSVWFWQYLNYVYASNKTDAPQKWNGSAWSAMGVAAPLTAVTLAVGGAGTPNGTYTAKVSYVTPTVESNPGPASASVTVVSQQISISSIPIGPAGVTKRRIYFFKTGVSSVYLMAIEIADNITTTATLTTDQPSWTTAALLQQDPPPTGPWLTMLFKNRLWKAGDPTLIRRVFFSQVFIPEAWPQTFYVDIPFSFNDEVTSLFVLGDQLLVFGHTEMYYVLGDSPFSFIVRKSFVIRGTPSPWGIAKVDNTALYFSRFGLLSFDGVQGRVTSDLIEPQFTGIFQNVRAVNYAATGTVSLAYYDRLKAAVVSFPTGINTINDTTWWFFLRRQGWVQDTRASRLLMTLDGKGDLGDLYSFDVDNGYLRQWDPDSVYSDDGVAIQARFKTGVLTGDNPLTTKIWGWFTARARPSNATLQVNAEVDQGGETDTFVLNLARGAVIGTAVIGTATIAADFDDFEERFAPNMKGRGIAYDVTSSFTELLHIAQMYTTFTTTAGIRRRVGVGI